MPATKLSVWPVDELSRVFPQDLPPRKATGGWELAAAGDEYCGFQIGLRAEAPLKDIEVIPGTLRKGKDNIPAAAVKVNWAGLVPVAHDAFWPEGAERPDHVPGWYPDPLLEQPPWTGATPPRSASVYLTLHIPRDAAPGVYRGAVAVRCQGKERAKLPLEIEVWPFALPKRPSFHVTNWFQHDCVTKWHRCEPWSERHWKIMDLYAATMAAYRQDVITTPTLIGNFHNSDPMTLVDAVRAKDGALRFDFRRLDRWVKLFDRHGFELFEMWHLASQAEGKTAPPFPIFDEKKDRRVWLDKLEVLSPEYCRIVGAFLRELSRWLDRRGLSRRFLLHVYDEPKKETWPHYAKLSAFFREHAPKLRHIDAISTSELITQFKADIDIPVPLTPHLENDAYYRQRAKEGKQPVWWYTCCAPAGRYANRFACQPLITTRILPWQAFAHGIGGYLHWGYNFWHRTGQQESGWPGINNYADHTLLNPFRDHPAWWATGDAAIIYPHPRWWEDRAPLRSLRYEAHRAGLQDYELLRMLESIESRRAQTLLAAARGPIAGSLTDFTRDGKKLLTLRKAIGRIIAGQ